MQTIEKALHQPMPFTTGGQTISDRLTAAKHSLAGSQLGKTICKATTEELMAPKKKHLDYLLHCTNEPNVSIPSMANMLLERTQQSNWTVVYKALITIHNIMCYGNERFSQYLASCNATINLTSFLDKNSATAAHCLPVSPNSPLLALHPQHCYKLGISPRQIRYPDYYGNTASELNGHSSYNKSAFMYNPRYDMSNHVRRYGKYIGEKIATYRTCAFDFCKVKRGKEDGMLRKMHADKLLKTLPILQNQIDALLEFQVSSSELNNGVINCSFILLFRDLIRLFACYNDGIINLLEKYFSMNKKQCREALDTYKGFLTRLDKVAEFLRVAESVGIDRGEIPDLTRAPASLLEALESHLIQLEGGRPPPPQAHNIFAQTQNQVQMFSSAGGFQGVPQVTEADRQRFLELERQKMQQYEQERRMNAQGVGSSNNPFSQEAAANVQGQKKNDDLLDFFSQPATTTDSTNPFAQFSSAGPTATSQAQVQQQPQIPLAALYQNQGVMGIPGYGMTAQQMMYPQMGGQMAYMQQQQPAYTQPYGAPSIAANNGVQAPFDPFKTGVAAPMTSSTAGGQQPRIGGDIDSALSNLAENLKISGQQINPNKPIPWGNAPSSGGPPARPPAPSTSVAPMANNPFAPAAVTATSSAYGAQMPYGQPQAGWAMQPGMNMYNQPQVYPQMAYGAIPQMPQGGAPVSASVAAAPLGQPQTTSAPSDPFAF
ncbi:hypothetical protein WR25_22309 [Diploscapter pachys]|uniref:ENTH domain-containing protein n=1 Tax=Diploscapter pachys TaxID=2018661 RepID=A0A2A2K4I6_9BILA|nr:hypothetical protein WR25_22309 [Diploscapter pachys]